MKDYLIGKLLMWMRAKMKNNLFSAYKSTYYVIVLLVSHLSFCQEVHDTITEPNRATVSQKATATLIAYFETLVSKNILGTENLKCLCRHEVLTNPISEEDARSSDETFTYRKQISYLIEKNHDNLFDIKEIQKWASGRLHGLEEHQKKRDAVYDITRDVHRPMVFIPIPAGKYTSALDNTEFEISEGLEIQESELTQWQWSHMREESPSELTQWRVIEENPSRFIDGIDSEEMMIGPKKIQMRPNYPVECVPFERIEKYIKKLNDNDKEYHYFLPSIQEYEALVYIIFGKNWIDEFKNYAPCSDLQQTCSVNAGFYAHSGANRIWHVIGNVWEMTRDQAHLNNETIQLVFGGSYNTKISELSKINSLIRPIYYKKSVGKGIGFRLVRQKKEARQYPHKVYADINWTQSTSAEDNHWKWDKNCHALVHYGDGIKFISNHIEKYPQGCAKTLWELEDEMDDGDYEVDHIKTISLLGGAN
jgi:hypothetical protein